MTTAIDDMFFQDAGIAIDWNLDEATWRTAGRAFQAYAARRRRQGEIGPRRILADFVIGAHAMQKGYPFLPSTIASIKLHFPTLKL
jgi:hypothetical protein